MALTGSIFYNTETNQIFDSALKPVLTTDSFVEISREDYNALVSEVFSSDGSLGITFDAGTSGLTLFSFSIPEETPTPFEFRELIFNFLNSNAIFYGYSSIENAVSYHNCGITAWEQESLAFSVWRANTESLMYDNIFSFTADGITLPDLAGFTAQAGYFDVDITSPSRPNLFS